MQGTLIALSAEETLCIRGAYLLTVLRGNLSLFGATSSHICSETISPSSTRAIRQFEATICRANWGSLAYPARVTNDLVWVPCQSPEVL